MVMCRGVITNPVPKFPTQPPNKALSLAGESYVKPVPKPEEDGDSCLSPFPRRVIIFI